MRHFVLNVGTNNSSVYEPDMCSSYVYVVYQLHRVVRCSGIQCRQPVQLTQHWRDVFVLLCTCYKTSGTVQVRDLRISKDGQFKFCSISVTELVLWYRLDAYLAARL